MLQTGPPQVRLHRAAQFARPFHQDPDPRGEYCLPANGKDLTVASCGPAKLLAIFRMKFSRMLLSHLFFVSE